MPRVSLQLLQEGKNIELDCPRKKNLLRFLQENQIPVGSACGGHGLCASCKVVVVSGIDQLNRPNEIEKGLLERNRIPENERISCQCSVLGDIEITTSYW